MEFFTTKGIKLMSTENKRKKQIFTNFNRCNYALTPLLKDYFFKIFDVCIKLATV